MIHHHVVKLLKCDRCCRGSHRCGPKLLRRPARVVHDGLNVCRLEGDRPALVQPNSVPAAAIKFKVGNRPKLSVELRLGDDALYDAALAGRQALGWGWGTRRWLLLQKSDAVVVGAIAGATYPRHVDWFGVIEGRDNVAVRSRVEQ